MTVQKFRALVWKYYKTHGRHNLPWRRTHNSYRILVSEVMLQQTQVDRVIPYYRTWIKQYPTVRSPLGDVLRVWQGLGYNRRAKMLHDAAKIVMEKWNGKVPSEVEELQSLPGIGSYTARAVAAFAHNEDVVFIETNIRTAVIHNFFNDRTVIPDADILEVLAKALPKGKSREWYAALMDYGAHLKRSGIRTNSKSSNYIKQSVFEGSDRQVRGAILKTLLTGPHTQAAFLKLFPPDRSAQVQQQLLVLAREGLLRKSERTYTLP